MRLLVFLVSLAVLSAPALAQSTSSKKTPSLPSRVTSVNAVPASGTANQAVSPNVRKATKQALAEATAREHGCFALKVYAPEGQKLLQYPASGESPYIPKQFVLRTTCSQTGTFETVPLSAPVPSGK